jgi:type I restriction enzyme S subunit
MKKGWERRKLADVLKIQNGYAFDSKKFNSSKGMPLVRIRSLKLGIETETWFDGPYDDKYVVKAGDLLIGMDGEFGCFEWKGNPSLLNQRVCRLQDFTGALIPKFLFYGVNDYLKAIEDVTGFTTVKHLSSKQVLDIDFPVPPIPEQHRIVAILDEAFGGIATAKANAEKNLQNARALFESHLQSVFTQHGDDWKMEKLDNLTELARGHNPPKSKFSREQKPGYIRFYQIRDGATDDYTVYVPDTPQLHKMKKDDIMVVAYRHVGRAFRGVEGAFNVALCKISNARRDLLDDDFLFHLIPSQYVKGELLKRAERSLIPSMSIEHLREIKIPLPPIHEQKRLVDTIRRLTEETQRLESLYQQKLTALDDLKKSLLHQAFSGQLTERSIEEAAA